MEHLLGADRRTRNLYDIRAVKEIPEKAIRMAVEANSDPLHGISVWRWWWRIKMLRRRSVMLLRALPEAASAMKIFTDMNEAEAWLARPLDQIYHSMSLRARCSCEAISR